MKSIIKLIALIIITTLISGCAMLLLAGCSVFMASSQPSKKPVELFKEGTPRSVLLANFGNPLTSETIDNKRSEVYQFTQGYSVGTRAGRAVVHGTLDVLTLFIWEIAGTPIEGIFDGKEMAYEVTYNDDSRINSVVLLKK